MTRWFRFYDAALDDPKVQRLAPPIFKLWVNCLCVASRNNGILPGLADLAWTLRMDEAEVKSGLSALVAAGLLDSVPEGLSPHNWNERQYQSDSSAERMRRHRQKKRDGDDDGPSDGGGDVTVTPQNRTEADTETESSVADATGADAPPDPAIAEREYFQRGRQILGKAEGGTLSKLLKTKGGNVALARAVIETASTKDDPKEWVYGAINQQNRGPPNARTAPTVHDYARHLEDRLRADEYEPTGQVLAIARR